MGLHTLSTVASVSGKGKASIQHDGENRHLNFRPFSGVTTGVPASVTLILDPEAWDDLVAVVRAEIAENEAPKSPFVYSVHDSTDDMVMFGGTRFRTAEEAWQFVNEQCPFRPVYLVLHD